jgi:putative hemolysin
MGALFSLAVILAVILAVGSALFSALETALFSLEPMELERLRRKKKRYAESLTGILSNPRRLLSAIVLADVVLNVPLIAICLYLLRERLGGGVPFWARALALFGVVVLLCDLLPKVLALLHPYRFIRVGVVVIVPLLSWLAAPVRFLQRICDRVAEWGLPASLRGGNVLNEEEMATLVELGAEDGALQASESAMIQAIIRLGDKTARDCMTPRVDAVGFSDDFTNAQLAEKLAQVRFRRVPIYGETPDDVLGVLEVRAFLEEGLAGPHYTEQLAPPSFVPETMKALELMRSFLKRPQGLAIVVDEHGGTEGVITRADLVEEIIAGALPGGDRELYVEALGDGRLVASGQARLEDLGELLGIKIAVEGVDTVGGLAFHLAGQLPRTGEVLEGAGLRLRVRRMVQKRVEEVLVEALTAEAEAAGEGEGEGLIGMRGEGGRAPEEGGI